MPIDPVKIPQNVQIEDKIVGPLTLRQIIIMALGGGFSYMIYAAVQRSVGHVSIPVTIAIWVPAVIAAAFALVNINDLSLLRICFLLLERMIKPSQRTWSPRTGISITIRTSPKPEEKPTAQAQQKGTHEEQIAELTRVIDRTAPAVPEVATTVETPVVTTTSAVPEPEPAPEPAPTPRPAVRPADIQVDAPSPALPALSDLSVFRDILPPTSTWQV